MMEGIYSRARHLGKEEDLGNTKEVLEKFKGRINSRSKEARKDRYGRRKRF